MKRFKHILTFSMAILMIAVMAMSSFAAPTGAGEVDRGTNETPLAPDSKGTITIGNAQDGDVFTGYKVLNITYDGKQLTYSFDAEFQAFLTSKGNQLTVEEYKVMDSDSDNLKSLLGGFVSYLKENTKPHVFELKNDNGYSTTALDLGQYVLIGTSTTSAKVFQLMTASFAATVDADGKYVYNETINIEAKADTPSIEKTPDNTSANIGDTINYEILVTVPTFPEGAINKKIIIHDTMTGLTFNENTLEVNGVAGGQPTKIEAANNYTLTKNTAGKTFTLEFTNYDAIKSYDSIKVTYSATVTEDAAKNQDGSSTNKAELEFSNDPYGGNTFGKDTPQEPEIKVYNYGFEATVKGENTGTHLGAGIEFNVTKGDDTPLRFKKDDVLNAYIYAPNGGADTITELVTDENGKVKVLGLNLGDYKLKQLNSAPGYKPVSVSDVKLEAGATPGKLKDLDSNILLLDITNPVLTTTLPMTGGMGTYVFVAVGLAIMVGAFVAMRKVENKAKKEQ